MLGRPRDQLLGKRLPELLPEAVRPAVAERLAEAVRERRPAAGGPGQGGSGLERYTQLFDFAPIGYFTVAGDGTIHQVNHSGARLLATAWSQLIGQSFLSFVVGTDRAAAEDFLAGVLLSPAASRSRSCEVTLYQDGGARVDVRLTGAVVVLEELGNLLARFPGRDEGPGPPDPKPGSERGPDPASSPDCGTPSTPDTGSCRVGTALPTCIVWEECGMSATRPDPEVQAYCDGLARGELVARRCLTCAKVTFPPAGTCEHCGSFSVEWVRLSGKGTLLFATPDERIAPHAYGHVRLVEGVVVQAIVTETLATPGVLRALSEHGTVPVVATVIRTDDGLPVLAFAPLRPSEPSRVPSTGLRSEALSAR